jgi:hypothetical protein
MWGGTGEASDGGGGFGVCVEGAAVWKRVGECAAKPVETLVYMGDTFKARDDFLAECRG